jgi:hypothetical protein
MDTPKPTAAAGLSPGDVNFGGRVDEVWVVDGNGVGDDVSWFKADGNREGSKELSSKPVLEGGSGVLVSSLDAAMDVEGLGILGVTVIVDMMVVAGGMLITKGLSPPVRVEAVMLVALSGVIISV